MSLRKTTRGRWMIDVKITRPSGETVRVRKTSPVQTRRGAQRFERQVREAVLDGTWDEPRELAAEPSPASKPVPRLGQWVETFIAEHSEAKGLRPATIREQRTAFRLYLVPVIGKSTRVDKIGRSHMLAVRKHMTGKGLAPKTINNALGVLSKALRFFYESRELAPPYWGNVRVKVPKSPPKFWEVDEYARLVSSAESIGPQALVAVLLMGDCGLRAGEVIGLEWPHVRHSPSAQLVVQRSWTDGHFGPPKSGRPRTVPMTGRLVAALAELPRQLHAPWILTREGGRHLTHSALAWLVAKVERDAGLLVGGPKARGKLHKLRHSYVTRLAASGAPARTIMELAGHTSMTTTMRYMHVMAGATASAVADLERFDKLGQHRGNAGPPKLKSAT